MNRSTNQRAYPRAFPLIIGFFITLLASGCATLTKPTWPWSDSSVGPDELSLLMMNPLLSSHQNSHRVMKILVGMR